MTENQVEIVDSINLSGILNSSHENKWVALSSDYSQVLATADTISDLMHSIKNNDVIFHRVLPHDMSFAPHT